jgi:hypothetical protein
MRRWHWPAMREHEVIVTPSLVQIRAGFSSNFLTNIYVGREFDMEPVPNLSGVAQWFGDTVGFWDGDVLVGWASNIQAWKVHGAFENSSELQAIEIYSPDRDAEGNFVGLVHEAVFYDPEVLVDPVRIVRKLRRLHGFETGTPVPFVDCVQSIFPIKGVATPVAAGSVIESYEVPDIYGRPWAEMWERYSEEGMERPEANEDIFDFE